MADVTQIFAGPGPLPLKTSVNIQSNAPAVVTLSGSVWSNAAQQLIGIALLIDGSVAGAATIFANPSSAAWRASSVACPACAVGRSSTPVASAGGSARSKRSALPRPAAGL